MAGSYFISGTLVADSFSVTLLLGRTGHASLRRQSRTYLGDKIFQLYAFDFDHCGTVIGVAEQPSS